jgi:hypothetical protein
MAVINHKTQLKRPPKNHKVGAFLLAFGSKVMKQNLFH